MYLSLDTGTCSTFWSENWRMGLNWWCHTGEFLTTSQYLIVFHCGFIPSFSLNVWVIDGSGECTEILIREEPSLCATRDVRRAARAVVSNSTRDRNAAARYCAVLQMEKIRGCLLFFKKPSWKAYHVEVTVVLRKGKRKPSRNNLRQMLGRKIGASYGR